MAPDCLLFATLILLPQGISQLPTRLFPVKSFVRSHNRLWLLVLYKMKLHVESTVKAAQIVVDNAHSLLRPRNVTVTILALIDAS